MEKKYFSVDGFSNIMVMVQRNRIANSSQTCSLITPIHFNLPDFAITSSNENDVKLSELLPSGNTMKKKTLENSTFK